MKAKSQSHSSKALRSYKIYPTPTFLNEAKKLLKRYPGIKEDYLSLKDELKKDPRIGDDLGDGLFKIRMDISQKNKGKSGCARVILKVCEDDNTVLVLRTYDKADLDDVIIPYLQKQVRKLDL